MTRERKTVGRPKTQVDANRKSNIREALPANVKTTSALRRIPLVRPLHYVKAPGVEGDVCAFHLAEKSAPVLAESVTGRMQTLVPGDVFLGTPGSRESNIVLVGGVPKDGLIAGAAYWLISESGVVGELITRTRLANRFLGEVTYLGKVVDAGGQTLTLRDFAVPAVARFKDHGANGGVRAPRSFLLRQIRSARSVGRKCCATLGCPWT